MTVYPVRLYAFACDAPGCEHVSDDILPTNPDDGRRSAWRAVRGDGWTERDRRHYCPQHRPR